MIIRKINANNNTNSVKLGKSNIHIFLCFNPLTNIYIKELIGKIPNNDDYIIIEFYKTRIITKVNNDRLIRLNYNNIIEYLYNIVRFKKLVNEMKNEYNSLQFYFSHPYHVISNYVFFSNDERYIYNLIPDGILNYYYINTKRYYKKMLIKKVIFKFLGIDYKIYDGHLTAFENNKYNIIYTLNQNDLLTYVEKNRVKTIKINSNINNFNNKIIILGQPYNDVKSYIELLILTINFLINNNVSGFNEKLCKNHIYYKAHPSEKNDRLVIDTLKKYNINIWKGDMQAELLVSDFNTFISFLCSALMNLKIMYADNCECYSFVSKNLFSKIFNLEDTQLSEIISVFENKGVDIKYV